MVESADPTVVRVVVVNADDVVTAYEARTRGGRDAVLRLTPPFSGRMRARLHAAGAAGPDPETEAVPVRIPPADLVDETAVPPYPDPADTGDALRVDPDAEYTVERHHDRHAEAVAAWREAAGEAIVDEVRLDVSGVATTGADSHRVEVAVLGD